MDGDEGGDGGEKTKRKHSPAAPESAAKRHEAETEQHCSVFSIDTSAASSSAAATNHSAETATTPSGIKKNTTPRHILSPQNLLSMIQHLKDPRKLDKKDISNELLYNLIIGQESRLFKLEQKVEALENENSELKIKLHSKNDLEKVKQDLAEASDGIASLEEFKAQCDTRLTDLEGIPQQISDDAQAQMQTGEQTDITIASDRVQTLQRELNEHVNNMTNFRSNIMRENRRRHLEWDQQEQYSRRDCVIVKGVPQKRGEDTTNIVCRIAYSIGVSITAGDISTSHRTGRQVGNIPRPIICKFTRRDTKYQIMANRSEARHIKTDDDGNPVRIFIDENLTQMRARVCKKLRMEKTPHKVKDGKIHLITGGENPTTEKILDSPSDWEGLDWPDAVKIELGVYPKD